MMFYCLWHLRDIVPPLITILLSNFANPPSASGFVIEAGITLPDALASLHWLRVPECVLFKVTYRTVNGSDPVYLSSYFHTVADVPARMRLRSSTSDRLFYLTTSLLSAGGPFPVSAANLWNSLTAHLTSAPLLTVFRQRLKSFLPRRSSYLII